MHETTRYPRPFGKYLLLRQLAVGGMAEVYLARQSGPAGFEKECVIKRILPSLAVDQQFVQMFLDEARIAARLSHPNIVQIYDLGTIGNSDYFLAMEHVHGVDLQQIADAEAHRNGRLPLAIALRLVSNVAEGLDHAHRATDARGAPLGIVHRDVTPSNVIVSFDGVAKILDFGIAKAVAKQGRTEVGVIKGKVPYMSPEQVGGEAIDGRSDLFSLGAVLYELTVGQKPFDGSNPAELSIKIMHDEPTPPEMMVADYPEALAAIVKRALNKRRQGRFASAREMQEAIEEFLISTGVRCTSHDVSAYLNDLFPGRREREASEEQAIPAVEATDPTMPHIASDLHRGATANGSGPKAQPDLNMSSPNMGDYDDLRRNLGGGGGGTKYIIVLLVIAVAAGFWWAAKHMGGGGGGAEAAPDKSNPAVANPTAAAPDKSNPAVANPANANPAANPANANPTNANPTEDKAAAEKAAAEKAAAAEKEKVAAEKAASEKAAAEKAAAEKAAAEKAAAESDGEKSKKGSSSSHHHSSSSSHHTTAPEPERSLPRLPTPPPADDAP